MKAIITAAGLGSRLFPLTADRPKCMIEVGGRPILQHAVDRLRAAGIEDIVVVVGYRADAIDIAGIRTIINAEYRRNNILGSFFKAREFLRGELLFLYSDIIFGPAVVERLVCAGRGTDAVSTLAVDADWSAAYLERKLHPVSEAELVVAEGGRIIELGKHVGPAEAFGEWCGIAHFSAEGTRTAVEAFDDLEAGYRRTGREPFPHATGFDNAYMTDFFGELVDRGHAIHACEVGGRWMEIDTPEDLERARRLVDDGILGPIPWRENIHDRDRG